MNPLAATILILTVGAVLSRQVLLRGPPIWLIFLVGAFASVAVGVLSTSDAAAAISGNFSILIFLFSLFIFAAGLEQAGALDHLARWILAKARRPSDLPLVLFLAVGVVSAFVINDALVLVGVPVLFAVARRLKVSAEPLLLTLAFSVTVGSVLTPFGNPQNLLVSLGSGMNAPVATFLRYLLLPTIVNLVLGGLYLRRVFRAQLDVGAEVPSAMPPAVPLFPRRGWVDLPVFARTGCGGQSAEAENHAGKGGDQPRPKRRAIPYAGPRPGGHGEAGSEAGGEAGREPAELAQAFFGGALARAPQPQPSRLNAM